MKLREFIGSIAASIVAAFAVNKVATATTGFNVFNYAPGTIRAKIFSYFKNAGLPDKICSYIVGMSGHETAGWTSNFYKKYNNLFGYSYYKGSSWQYDAGTKADNGKPIAVYLSIENSMGELLSWLKRRLNEGRFPAFETIDSPEKFVAALKSCGYFTDTETNYLRGLKYYM